MTPWGVIVAGGSGARYGRLKQLEPLGGQRVLDWSVRALKPLCAGLVVVVPEQLVDTVQIDGVDAVVAGGADRSASVRAGLDAVEAGATHILVHDAARPLLTSALIERVITALADGADGAVPVVAISDSLRTVEGEPVDRSAYVAVQTPQGFTIKALRDAHDGGTSASDDATLVAAQGLVVRHVSGESSNLKITEPVDLEIAEALLRGR